MIGKIRLAYYYNVAYYIRGYHLELKLKKLARILKKARQIQIIKIHQHLFLKLQKNNLDFKPNFEKFKKVKLGLDPKSLRINPRSYWQDFTVETLK